MGEKFKLSEGDVLAWAAQYNGEKFHAIITDPPYHLTSITKRFGKPDSAPAKHGRDGAFQRASAGFMGQTWDGGDVAFRPETWAALREHLYPGAFGFAYAASRGWHRMAVAIEDAGFIIHPSMFAWAYSSGMPKATRIDNQIDRDAGVEPDTIPNPLAAKQTGQTGTAAFGDRPANDEIKLPATQLAKTWSGHRYGLGALKPAVEPIILFQNPYDGRPLDNIVQTGAGALNIEAARIPGEPYIINRWSDGSKPFGGGAGHPYEGFEENGGRWPANLVIDERIAQRSEAGNFFFRVQEDIDEADPLFYCPKAGRAERDAGLEGRNPHPTVKPLSINRYLSGLLLPPAEYAPRRIMVPFCGAGSEIIGALQAGWDEAHGIDFTPSYLDVARKRLYYWVNKTPTIRQMRLNG